MQIVWNILAFAAGFLVGVKAMHWSVNQKVDEIIKDLERK